LDSAESPPVISMASVFVMVSLPLTVCDLDRCLQGAAWVAYLSEGLEGGAHIGDRGVDIDLERVSDEDATGIFHPRSVVFALDDGDDRTLGHTFAFQLDAVRHDKSLGGRYEDVADLRYAVLVVDAYMRRYAPAAYRRRDLQTMARVHNGGPSGHRKQSTLRYWSKLQVYLR
jgi:hypothetical protein